MFVGGVTFAQTKEVTNADSSRNVFIPTGIRLGMDAITTVKNFTAPDFKGWEVSADADFRNYYLVAEIGNWKRDIDLNNGHYTNSGNYWRVGVDINFLKKDPIKNMFFIGLRYGHSKYDEQLDYIITTTEFGTVNKSLENTNFKASWLELTTGLKVKVLKAFWMGYTARLKFAPNFNNDQQLQTYDIPGYGLTFKKNWWGFNYYLMYRIPLPKRK
jgi:hypothetical protein